MHALDVAGSGAVVEREFLAALKDNAVAREAADPELRPLEIRQNRNGAFELRLELTDERNALAQSLPREMAHVQPEHVGASREELADHLGRIGRWAQGRND